MTATNFRDLLDPYIRSRAALGQLLALPVPWVDCPSGCFKGGTFKQRNRMLVKFPCPACSGTGKATVAQLLAWGQAVAETVGVVEWGVSLLPHQAVDAYRNQILDVQP